MGLYLIGDFIVDLKNKYDYIQNQCAEYEYKGTDSADFVVEVNDKDLEAERKNSDIEYSNGYLESICAYRKLCLDIPSRDAMLLHGSVISCNGRGIAFLARSGVGKTTHTKLWKTVYKDKVEIINGDKPIIRFHQGIPFAYGTPWAGKEGFQTNSKVELTDICFIERSQENITQKINSVCCFDAFMAQILHPAKEITAIKTLEMADNLMKNCNLWSIKCNISEDAARVAYKNIMGE